MFSILFNHHPPRKRDRDMIKLYRCQYICLNRYEFCIIIILFDALFKGILIHVCGRFLWYQTRVCVWYRSWYIIPCYHTNHHNSYNFVILFLNLSLRNVDQHPPSPRSLHVFMSLWTYEATPLIVRHSTPFYTSIVLRSPAETDIRQKNSKPHSQTCNFYLI